MKGSSVTWQVLEGDDEKEMLKKIIEAQQESYNRSKGRGTFLPPGITFLRNSSKDSLKC